MFVVSRLDQCRDDVRDYVFKDSANTRSQHLMMIPFSTIVIAVSTIVGAGAVFKSAMSTGTDDESHIQAVTYLHSSKLLLVSPYLGILGLIDPTVHQNNLKNPGSPYVEIEGAGFLPDFRNHVIKDAAANYATSSHCLVRNGIARLTYAAYLVACVVTRVADAIIGVVAAGLSLITGGRVRTLNNLAIRGLQAPCIIQEICFGVIRFFNPWSGTSPVEGQVSAAAEKQQPIVPVEGQPDGAEGQQEPTPVEQQSSVAAVDLQPSKQALVAAMRSKSPPPVYRRK